MNQMPPQLCQEGIDLDESKTFLVCDDPYLAYAESLNSIAKKIILVTESKNNVFVHETAKLGNSINIGPNVYIGQNCSVGDNAVIFPNTTILKNVYLGITVRLH